MLKLSCPFETFKRLHEESVLDSAVEFVGGIYVFVLNEFIKLRIALILNLEK